MTLIEESVNNYSVLNYIWGSYAKQLHSKLSKYKRIREVPQEVAFSANNYGIFKLCWRFLDHYFIWSFTFLLFEVSYRHFTPFSSQFHPQISILSAHIGVYPYQTQVVGNKFKLWSFIVVCGNDVRQLNRVWEVSAIHIICQLIRKVCKA